jgi:hypothetical protein
MILKHQNHGGKERLEQVLSEAKEILSKKKKRPLYLRIFKTRPITQPKWYPPHTRYEDV